MRFFRKEFTSNHVLAIGFFVYLSVLILNDGFMALDEYFVGIVRYIPAQSSSLMNLVAPDDVKSPLQLLPMHAVAQLALSIGITEPYWQYRAVILILGLISILVLGYAFVKFSEISQLEESKKSLLFLMMIFYFAAPFGVTRPMFESIAAPWLALSAVYAFLYDQKAKLNYLLLGVLTGSLAFVLRQQLGICALVFILLPALKKNWKHLFYAGLVGLLFFILSGIPDHYIRGKFHYSLLNLTLYNYEHGSDYGNQSVLFYPALIFVITLFPFFILKYPTGFLKLQFVKYRSFYMVLGLFVFLHSLFPNKWERFVISILPILVLIFFPFLDYIRNNYLNYKWRLAVLVGLNCFLFVIASYFPAQKNLIEMSLFLNKHPEIKKIHRINETPGWITDAFILNKSYSFIESNEELLSNENWQNCEAAFVVGSAQADSFKTITDRLNLLAVFNVNLIEKWAFKLNPDKNPRRVQLRLYSGCKV
jgi:hypothetical protein